MDYVTWRPKQPGGPWLRAYLLSLYLGIGQSAKHTLYNSWFKFKSVFNNIKHCVIYKMTKRSATTELNHDNWNLEDEPDEDPGVFTKASKEDMNKRVIRTAVRRLPNIPGENGGKSVFSSFGGFGIPNKPDKPNLFANIGSLTPNDSSKDNEKVENKNPTFSLGKNFSFKNGSDVLGNTNDTKKDDKKGIYLSKLKGLNESIIEWIKTHFEKNPTCILTPIFADYDKYLKEIQAEKDTVESNPINTKETTSFSFSKLPTKNETKLNSKPISLPKKDDKEKTSTEEKTPTEEIKPTFSFGSSTPSFGLNSTPFGKTTPFTFSPSIPDNTNTTSTENTEEEGAGEKYNFVPVVENEALFSQRVKVFVKKDTNYADKGVGILYIKNVEGKYQAVVRADTNLGNVLLNIILNKDIPSDRVGKNNVTLVCIPTPDSQPPPMPVLLRVKTGEEADKLLETINKYKNMDKNESSD